MAGRLLCARWASLKLPWPQGGQRPPPSTSYPFVHPNRDCIPNAAPIQSCHAGESNFWRFPLRAEESQAAVWGSPLDKQSGGRFLGGWGSSLPSSGLQRWPLRSHPHPIPEGTGQVLWQLPVHPVALMSRKMDMPLDSHRAELSSSEELEDGDVSRESSMVRAGSRAGLGGPSGSAKGEAELLPPSASGCEWVCAAWRARCSVSPPSPRPPCSRTAHSHALLTAPGAVSSPHHAMRGTPDEDLYAPEHLQRGGSVPAETRAATAN